MCVKHESNLKGEWEVYVKSNDSNEGILMSQSSVKRE